MAVCELEVFADLNFRFGTPIEKAYLTYKTVMRSLFLYWVSSKVSNIPNTLIETRPYKTIISTRIRTHIYFNKKITFYNIHATIIPIQKNKQVIG